jgi:hypothetical protein
MKVKCLGIAALERCMWRQRSRFLWLKEGDCNSKFFHVKASARRRKSLIPSITVNDVTTVDQERKKEAIWKHFNDLIGTYKPSSSSINLSILQFPVIDMQSLSNPILESEVRETILELHPEKAPGPDGFTGLFYRLGWDTIKSDVMKAIIQLESAGTQGLHLLNSALMVLLPKSPEAASPSDFRPISLVHSFGKLFTKIMAKRLQPMMPGLVAPCQNAFIKGKSIHDNFVYVQRVVHSLKHKKIPALMMKLDISKAFDSVSWEFLLKLLAHRGFDRKWINWIVALLSSSSTNIIVNGELTEKIHHRRGLRQGDPVSPLLFVLVMDCLGRLLDKAQSDLLLPHLGNQVLRF